MSEEKQEKKKDMFGVRIPRGEDGEVRTVDGTSPVLAMDVRIRPMTYGDSRRYESFGEALFSWTDEDKIACLNRHVISPEIHIEDVEDLHENFDPWTVEDLMQAVFVYSGMSRLFGDDEEEEGNLSAEEETGEYRPVSA